uniref:Retrotransposon Copia-like N-terminal domain-containing protein n=1 Tax=Nelumbo nucifera TaxID=4432 RepID=A0A822YEP6_NELNU|nr:TPA_asm: hypothetical protein HUJ06_029456 [Nelumbo nucifera]
MTMALSAKNKMGFVDSSITKPASIDPLLPSWVRVNNMVLSWILNSLHKDLAPNVLYAESASVVWKDLRERFSISNGPRIYKLLRAIATHHQHSLSVATYYNALKCY